jgi:hypothetical protein
MCADQDSVRLLAVECCASLGKLLERQDCVTHVLPIIISFSQVSPTLTLNHLLAAVEAGLYCIMLMSLHFRHSLKTEHKRAVKGQMLVHSAFFSWSGVISNITTADMVQFSFVTGQVVASKVHGRQPVI